MSSEPSKESLKFFHNWMVNGNGEAKTWPVENIRDVARMIDAVRTLPSVPDETVESALVKMREKYPGGCPYIIAQDFTALGGRRPIEVRIIAGGTQYGKDKGDTLAEALALALEDESEDAIRKHFAEAVRMNMPSVRGFELTTIEQVATPHPTKER